MITYEDKENLRNINIPAKNQVTAEDMNEIKEQVNSLFGTMPNRNGIGEYVYGAFHATNGPNSGEFNFDTATITSATKFRVAIQDNTTALLEEIFNTYDNNDMVLLKNKIDPAKQIFLRLGNWTLETGYYEFEILEKQKYNSPVETDEFFFLVVRQNSNSKVLVIDEEKTLDNNVDLYLCDASVASFNVNVLKSSLDGKVWNIKKIDNTPNPVTIDWNMVRTIDGEEQIILEEYGDSVTIVWSSAKNQYYII